MRKREGRKRMDFYSSSYRCIKLVVIILTVFLLSQIIIYTFAADGTDSSRDKEVRARTERVINSREFAARENESEVLVNIARGLKDFVDGIWERIKQLLSKLIPSEAKIAPIDDGLGAALNGVFKAFGIAFVAVILFLVIYISARNFRRSGNVREREDADLLLSLADSDVMLQKALEYGSNGDFRQGIRFLYIALLLKLNEFEIIKIDKSKTNRQYVNEIRDKLPEKIQLILEFTYDFNMFWYGNKPAARERFELWKRNYDLLSRGLEK
ncbi:MAG: hypothetical protein N2489_08995 [Clostridia bacterium]|nr:hypothetical protein [Clostridia bacterium]